MKSLSDKKMIQRRRKMRHFIEAADCIISKEGKDAVTIRAVSDLACYNSATLYNYFENMEHLLYYTYLRHIKMIERRLSCVLKNGDSQKRQVRQIWSAYCDMAYGYPEIIYTLLFSPYNVAFEDILEDYLSIFSDEFDAGESERILQMFKGSLFNVQHQSLTGFGETQGLSMMEIEELKKIVITFFQGMLLRQTGMAKNSGSEEYMRQARCFIERIMNAYTSKIDHAS
ncbi:MAG: TetR/AcrR family transcriptional regulator [Bacillota bacterium]